MDTVPLTRVTLYKSPHAFIERDGFTAPAGWPGYRPLTEK